MVYYFLQMEYIIFDEGLGKRFHVFVKTANI